MRAEEINVNRNQQQADGACKWIIDDARRWQEVIEIADVVSGKIAGRRSESDITLFKSNGIAIEDIVTAGKIYELAERKGIGREVPMWQGADH